MRLSPGITMAALAGICFGSAVPLAALSYSQGANVFGYMLAVRVILAAGLIAICWRQGKNFWPGAELLPILLIMGIINAGFSALHYGAIAHMKVGLVTMIIFLYPFILSLFSIVFDRVVPSRIFYLSAVLALTGLYFVLGPEWGAFNWLGGGMAFAAAVLIAVYLFTNGRMLQNADPEIYGAQLMFSTLLIFTILAATQDVAWPITALGWYYILGGGLIVLLGQVVFFRAIQSTGAVSVSLYIKIEPVATLVLAALLLGEKLSMIQLFGAGLVLAALVLNARDKTVEKREARGKKSV